MIVSSTPRTKLQVRTRLSLVKVEGDVPIDPALRNSVWWLLHLVHRISPFTVLTAGNSRPVRAIIICFFSDARVRVPGPRLLAPPVWATARNNDLVLQEDSRTRPQARPFG